VNVIRKIRDLRREAKIESNTPTHLNFAVTDGQTVIATKYVDRDDAEPASLYFTSGAVICCDVIVAYRS
jgi:glutamine amidotransferase